MEEVDAMTCLVYTTCVTLLRDEQEFEYNRTSLQKTLH